jgi:hypothetical protein
MVMASLSLVPLATLAESDPASKPSLATPPGPFSSLPSSPAAKKMKILFFQDKKVLRGYFFLLSLSAYTHIEINAHSK